MLAVLTAAVWATLGGGVAFGESLEGRVTKLEGKMAAVESRAATLESKVAVLEATLKGVTQSGNTIDFSGVNVKVDNGKGKRTQPTAWATS
jgi:hypothetical protein